MIRIIDTAREDCRAFIDGLASGRGVISREVVEKVEGIVGDIKMNGDDALLRYTLEFDKVKMDAGMLKVKEQEFDEACAMVDPLLLDAIKGAARNIRAYHEKQRSESWFYSEDNGTVLGQRQLPLERVGVYVPGGTAPLPSSLLMCVIPAKVAGVGRIIVATPPGKDGSVNPAVLAAAREAGVDEVYRMGGAQAVAALAFGTGTVPRVDKIVGPGNVYVSVAKKLVFGFVDIDMIAGPSEIAVIADEKANPAFVAADMLSQAEHDKMSAAILLTDSMELARLVKVEIERQYQRLDRKEIIGECLEKHGVAFITGSMDEAVALANIIAPEHLELCVEEPFKLLWKVRNAGAVFLGEATPEPVGDYFAGPSHVLPTSGTARFSSPLGVYDFVKKTSVIYYTPDALGPMAGEIIRFAEAEGLAAHANAVKIRLKGECT